MSPDRTWSEMLTNRDASVVTGCNDPTFAGPARTKPGYSAAWGISLKFAGAFPYRTLVWLAFVVTLALTALPLVVLARRGADLSRELCELRLQVDVIEQELRRLSETNRLLSLSIDAKNEDLHSQAQAEIGERALADKGSTSSFGAATSEITEQKKVQSAKISENAAPTFLFPYNDSLSSYKHPRRLIRAVSVLPDCPKPKKRFPGPIFMHVHGDGDQQYETASALKFTKKAPVDENDATNPHPDTVAGWIEQEWCKYPKSKRPIYYDTHTGGIQVTQPGFYLLYAQMSFVSFHQTAVFQVFAKAVYNTDPKRLVASCYQRDKNANFNQLVTCSIATVVCLNNHDRVFVTANDVTIDMQKGSSFFGLYNLYAATTKGDKPFCPTGESKSR